MWILNLWVHRPILTLSFFFLHMSWMLLHIKIKTLSKDLICTLEDQVGNFKGMTYSAHCSIQCYVFKLYWGLRFTARTISNANSGCSSSDWTQRNVLVGSHLEAIQFPRQITYKWKGGKHKLVSLLLLCSLGSQPLVSPCRPS